MFERFAQSARVAVDDARSEAGCRGDRRIGSEHLLLALLQDDMIAHAVGVDAETARVTADKLDRAALVAVGIDLADMPLSGRVAVSTHVPFTPGAKEVLRRTLAHAAAEKAKSIKPRHLVLALLDRVEPDPAAAILAALSVDPADIRQRLDAPDPHRRK